MTWYLKYRPQTIAQLDLTSIREQLGGIFSGSEVPHAFLFTGPRGVGKTSAARIIAKTLNCQKKKKSEPCNECDMCVSITAGGALDIVEIDAASNRGIDEIRDLREKIRLAPLAAKYKVYIIDEVHMLTTEAFNALLKTLEEPPAHVVFVLCTTELEKIPQTVVSRCTLVKFKRPSVEEMVVKLAQVVEGEKLKLSSDQLSLIAKSAQGSFRDAIKILEQVTLSGQSVAQILGILESADPVEFVTAVANGDSPKALEMINNLVEQGANLRGFIERCVEQLREQLLAGEPVLELIARFEQAYVRTRDSAVPQLPLEILAIEKSVSSANSSSSGKKEVSPHPEPVKEMEVEALPVQEKKITKLLDSNLGEVESKWAEVLKAVRPQNHSVEALLRSTRPIGFDGHKLTLEVFYKFHKDKLESDRCRNIIETALGMVLGTDPVPVDLQLGQRIKREEVSAESIDEDIVKAAEEIFKVDAI
ncbi:MAG: DNA polymerase III subunit gamma/tau [bacterium]|nr:DNA polymerase III subunit gamma/tau [bacterium]